MKKMYTFLLLSFSVLAVLRGQQVILNFESPETSRNFQYFGSSLENKLTTVVDNPKKEGKNTSAKVIEFVKPADAQTWAGAFSVPDLSTAVDLTKPGSQLCIKVLIRHTGNIALKLEASADGGQNWIQKVNIDKANEWVEVCVDPTLPSLEDAKVTAAGHTYARLVLFVDFNLNGAAVADTTYLDDVTVAAPTATTCRTVYSFEADSTSTTFQYFGSSLDNSKNKVVNNPQKAGLNQSDKVAEFIKPLDAQTWAGAFSAPGPTIPLEIKPGTEVCMKVWMDHPGNVALKLEGSTNGGANWAQVRPVSKGGEWVEICFDPSVASFEDPKQPAVGFSYKTVVLFFDFGKSGAESADTSYFDDLVVCQKSAPSAVPVRFAVDMSKYTDTFEQVFVSGTFNEWSNNATPLTDTDGDDIWTAEVQIAPGGIEYKFQVDGWKAQEAFIGTEVCTKTTGSFTNRFLVVPSSGLPKADTVCWNSCYACGESIRITVRLGAQHITVDSTGLFIAGGGNFGIPGDFQLKDADKDGIYSIVFERPKGFSSFYTFTNGACTDYSCKENIAGQACANPANYNDRNMGPFTQDTVISTCFGQCTSSAECAVQAKRKVTLKVNMSAYSQSFVNVYVSGTFNNWSANANRLFDEDGDNTYEAELELSDATYEYKFQVDGWSAQEEFKGGEACTRTTGGFTNRLVDVKKDTVLPVVCFNSCTACAPTSVPALFEASLFNVYPNPVSQELVVVLQQVLSEPIHWMLTDVSGRSYPVSWKETGAGAFSLPVAELPNGIYWLRLTQGNQFAVRKVVVLH